MPQVTGRIVHADGSPASGRRVAGVAAGLMGGMVGPTSTDSNGYFSLTWNSSTRTLAKLFLDGRTYDTNVSEGNVGTIVLR